MQGVIIAFDMSTQEGVICVESGQQYRFDLTGWRGRGLPDEGLEVSFDAVDDVTARQVFNLPSGQLKAVGTQKLGQESISQPWYKKLKWP